MLKRSIFIFRRDLRLQDNLGLIEAMEASHSVIPVFIIDPQLLARWRGAEKRLTFLTMALRKLDETLRTRGSRLVVLEGSPIDVVSNLIDAHAVDVYKKYLTQKPQTQSIGGARPFSIRANPDSVRVTLMEFT